MRGKEREEGGAAGREPSAAPKGRTRALLPILLTRTIQFRGTTIQDVGVAMMMMMMMMLSTRGLRTAVARPRSTIASRRHPLPTRGPRPPHARVAAQPSPAEDNDDGHETPSAPPSKESSGNARPKPEDSAAAARRPQQPKRRRPARLDAAQRERELTLAFLGDAVWALHARTLHLLPPRSAPLYRARATALQRAEAQAAACDALLALPAGRGRRQPGAANNGAPEPSSSSSVRLTQVERALLRRLVDDEGVVARGKFRRREGVVDAAGEGEATATATAAANDALIYRKATALEALVGHLQLTNPRRLAPLMGVALAAAERAAEPVAAEGERDAREAAALGAAGKKREKTKEAKEVEQVEKEAADPGRSV